MEGGGDIDTFEITKFDYRRIFKKYADQNVSYREILHKIFEIKNILDLGMDRVRKYEFQSKVESSLNPNTLHNTCPNYNAIQPCEYFIGRFILIENSIL